jgi:hypothetical protein
VPYGALGTGISDASFKAGIRMGPDIIACDAGSTDSGPYYLGAGRGKYARDSVKEDLRRMVKAGRLLNIPVAVGSAGTCGTDSGVDELAGICVEICKEEGLSARIAKNYTQQDPMLLKKKYEAGRIIPLEGAPLIDATVFERCTNIVGLAGAEPFQESVRQGADIILCGRATDTAIIAAMPLMKGCNEAGAWHGAKIAECGALCTTIPSEGGVFVSFDEDGFTIEPASAESRCTAYTVSAHMLYENADPYRLREPSGILDTRGAVYTELDERRVRVRGSAFTRMPYTVKLEGASLAGYQTLTIVGIQDRQIMQNPEKWLGMLKNYVAGKIKKYRFDENSYGVDFKIYGWNAVSGSAPPPAYTPREAGVVMTVTAGTQELAARIAKIYNPYLLHFPVNPEAEAQLPTFAFPFSPAEIDKGPLYEFMLHHAVEVDDPMELFRMEMEVI